MISASFSCVESLTEKKKVQIKKKGFPKLLCLNIAFKPTGEREHSSLQCVHMGDHRNVKKVFFVGRQLCWKDHLVFICHAVWMDGWMDVRSHQHQKVNLHSLMRTKLPIFVKLGMWVVGGTSTTHEVCHH